VLNRGFSSDSCEFEIARAFKGHNLEPPDNTVTTTKEEMMEFYKTMVYYRRFEIVADTLYKQRLIRGFCHLYDGQEAIVIGMEKSIKKTDSVITSYRDHCHQIARGDTGARVMAELLGKAEGCSKGKGGSMHMYHPEGNFYGGNGIVGAQVPLGLGLAFAHHYRKDGGVAIAAYGDGAANQGQIAESMNMAALWKLPIIFLCENNEYGMGTAIDRASAASKFYKRGDYIPGLWLDGMDVLASKKGFAFAADWCRSGKGPIVVEASTYRYHGHSMSDPGISYRSRDEVQEVKRERDCIDQTRNRILDKGWATAAELKAIDKEVRKMVDSDAKFAKAGSSLPADELFVDVYANNEKPPYIRTVDYTKSIITPA
jgi:pyruvate dehydrogenase E1 component alpha subunit